MSTEQAAWLTLRQIAAMTEDAITVEGLRLRLFKPDAPTHKKWRGRWLVNRDALLQSDWLE